MKIYKHAGTIIPHSRVMDHAFIRVKSLHDTHHAMVGSEATRPGNNQTLGTQTEGTQTGRTQTRGTQTKGTQTGGTLSHDSKRCKDFLFKILKAHAHGLKPSL